MHHPPFAASVYEILSELQTSHEFVPATLLAGDRFASLIRHENREICTYVYIHDGRSTGGNVDVDVWSAPLHAPDDGLSNLYVGFMTRIASEYTIGDDFFLKCQNRIVLLLSHATALAVTVKAELVSPAFCTRRLRAYLREVRVLNALLDSANDGDGTANCALAVARNAARGGLDGSMEDIENACSDAASGLLYGGSIAADDARYYANNPVQIGAAVAGIVYAHCLCELSRRTEA